jgi:hypothetical protein
VLATLIVAVLVWIHRYRLGPIYGLGIVLLAVVVFGPALRPWYVIWGLIPLAAAARHTGIRRAMTVLCAVLVPVVLPDGFAATADEVTLAVLGSLLGASMVFLVRLSVARNPAWAMR